MRNGRFLAGILAAVMLLPAMALQATGTQSGYHQAYLFGYPDGTVRPEAEVTREELAQILFRLVGQEPEKLQTNSSFCDVTKSRWSYRAISAMAGLGVLPGGADGRYQPKKAVSGEALTAVLDLITYTDAKDCFPVISGRWEQLRGSIADSLAQKQTVSRAETAELLNRLMDRSTEASSQMGSELFPDNTDQTAWYYAQIREASVSHSWDCDNKKECWTAVG